MNTKTTTLVLGIMLAGCSLGVSAQQLAFPEAQGWGRFATGGRTGTVYHVTNLNNSGSGSLRDAVSQPNRIIVFDVSGVIKIDSRIVFSKNLYVAGQTAPGEGVTVYGDGVSFSGANNIIVRHMRFRMGHIGSSGKDCAGIANGTNMIFDHCSFAWGLDETFSINPDGKGTAPEKITISNSVIGQGLMPHSAGGLIQSDSITLYRNLYCDNSTRNNKVKGANQYINNVVYNWKNGAYIMGGDSEGSSYCNIESNLFINGPAVGGAAFTGANSDYHVYGDDNWQDRNADGEFNPAVVTDYSASDRQSTPYKYPVLDKWAGNTLITNLLPVVGASLPYRDYVDYYMVDEVMSFGKKGALISNESNLIYGAPDTWTVWKGNKRIDTDSDGMPDAWEAANGTNPNANDAMVIAANGYANIENYINSITVDSRDYFLRAPMCVELASATTTTLKLSWRDYTYGESGFAIELKTADGEYAEVGRTAANATSFTITNLEPGTPYSIRLRSFDEANKTSEYTSEMRFSTRPIEVGVVDIDTYEADYTWNKAVTEWNLTAQGWNDGNDVFANGKKVLFAPTENAEITLNETVEPSVVVVNSDADVTISGTGAIAGTTSVNKAGEGTLVMNTANTYTGATVLHEGVFSFNTLKNGGVASALGASVEFAQNWLFDGGTYNYTGGSTATNRSAKITRETEFNIADKNAIVAMNGTMEGTDNLVLNGEGQLTVGTTKFFGYTGNTILKGGKLYLSTVDIAKNGIGSSSKLVFAGGELKTKGEDNGYETYSFPIEVTEGTTSQFSPNRNCYINNTVTGSGTLQLNIPYLREYIKGDFSEFNGTLIANGVSTDKNGSLFLINDNKINLKNVVVEAKGNARVCVWETNGAQTLGGLSGTSGTYLVGSSKNTKGFNCSWTIGSANTNETFAGRITNWATAGSSYVGTVSIKKTGTGDWRLTGANDYKGTTIVSGGNLIVNGTNSGAGQVSVTDGAVLSGVGTIAGKVSVINGGTILAGDTLVNGKGLTLNGGCTVNAGGIMELPVFANNGVTRANRIKIKGVFAVNDAVLSVNMSEAGVMADDQLFAVLDVSDATVSGNGFISILPERPSATQVWDTSALLTKGYLYVRNASTTAINGVDANVNADNSPKYDINGLRTNGTSKGLYIQNGKKYVKK